MWKLPKTIGDYIFDAATRIFSPNKDDYPKTGTQSYKGDPNVEK
ncbi:MAG: isochorismate synthase [Leptolyngbyaceae cyanobacterium CRU_2_3]|nr:isochorismate synthase [Leptolyngbyaceae cyanobacterium CRU_2_3]